MTTGGDGTRTWLLTGCSSGLGRALAEHVLASGDRCIATARDPKTIAPLQSAYREKCLVFALDVTDAAQREEVVARAQEQWTGIDVLVNNAAHGYSAAVEEGEEEVIRKVFETNFFALAAMIRLVLPGMRVRRRGHIVNVSSIGGFVGHPGSGYYNASKFAVEGLSQALAKEVAPFGLRVTLIEPGPFRTDFHRRSVRHPASIIPAYDATVGARRAQLKANDGKQPGDPHRAAEVIVRIARSDDPPLHLLLGRDAVTRARTKLTDVLVTIDRWEALSLAADSPLE